MTENDPMIICAGAEKKPDECIKCKEYDCPIKPAVLKMTNRSLLDWLKEDEGKNR